MKTIQCPSCGSVKVTILENEKAVCLACDSVFQVHDYSKEFKQTSQKIDDSKNEILKELKSIRNDIPTPAREQELLLEKAEKEYERLLEKAENYYKIGEEKKALEYAEDAADLFPSRAYPYIRMYEFVSLEYTWTNGYSTMLNEYEEDDDDERLGGGEHVASIIYRALKCDDCPTEFAPKVIAYQKECAQQAIIDICSEQQTEYTQISVKAEQTNSSIEAVKDALGVSEQKFLKYAYSIGITILALLASIICVLIERGSSVPIISFIVFLVYQLTMGVLYGMLFIRSVIGVFPMAICSIFSIENCSFMNILSLVTFGLIAIHCVYRVWTSKNDTIWKMQEDEKIYLEKVHQLEERKEFYVRASNILQGSDYQDILVEQYYYNDYR